MKNKDYKNLCAESLPLIKRTGKFIREELFKVEKSQIEVKDLNSLVSYVDMEAERQLVNDLGGLFPEAGFITEEDTVEQKHNGTAWIIDPLDGTSNYLHKIPHFAISVALMVDNQIVLGIVLNAYTGECFYAWKNGGAYLNGQVISVSETSEVSQSIIATGFPYKAEEVDPLMRTLGYFMQNGRGIRRFGAAALDLVFVACGRFDSYYEATLNAWDVAAGALIVQEAGGSVTDFKNGRDYLFGQTIIASNKLIHQEVQTIISEYFK